MNEGANTALKRTRKSSAPLSSTLAIFAIPHSARMTPASSDRLPWIDNLRTLLIVLVVNLHACVTYSHVGDWYFMSAQEPTLAAKVPFILWQAHLQSFFMGLLFFIAAYFAYGSIARRGVGAFVRERLLRLGLPALLYMLVIHPFILLVLNPWNFNFGPPVAFYVNYLRTGKFLGSTGPLWFVVALLLFSLTFAAWRSKRPLSNVPPPATAPTGTFLFLFALVLGFGSFAMRLVQPIGTNVLNMQLCFFVQYIAFFLAGLHAARHGWLLPLASSSYARTAGRVALFGGPVLLLAIIIIGARTAAPEAFFGGWRWQAFGYAVWEQLAGVGLSLGLLALFSRKCNMESQILRWLSDRSFGVYVFHAPVIIALAMLFRTLPQNMYALVALLTLTGLTASFAVADICRRLPGLRRIL